MLRLLSNKLKFTVIINNLAQGRAQLVVLDDNTLGYRLDGADAVPFFKGIYIEKLSNKDSSYSGWCHFTFENKYSSLTIDRIECFRSTVAGYYGTSYLKIIDETTGNVIYDGAFNGSASANPNIYRNIAVNLSAYKKKKITITYHLDEYGCYAYGIALK